MAKQDQSNPHVVILMPVRNGAAFLGAQVQSIVDQTHASWTLYAGDDGSTDNSRALLAGLAKNNSNIRVHDGPQRGQTANIVALLDHARPDLDQNSWLAFADQDDVWLPHRLSRGVDQLRSKAGPALYCARTIVVDHDLSNPRPSKLHPREPGFKNALVQNIASGNTILLNPPAAQLIRQAAPAAASVYAPDWWIYQLITGAGGTVIFDNEPALMYRQHGQNQFGENRSAAASQKRLHQILNGEFKGWIKGNTAALLQCEHLLTADNRAVLTKFAQLQEKGVLGRLATLSRLGLYRQTRLGTLAIWCAALLGRV